MSKLFNENGIVKFNPNLARGSIDPNGSIMIESKTLKDIFEQYDVPKIIDYISLDIEGYEYQALLGFPFENYEFIVMTVEHNLYLGDSSNKENIKKILTENGYVLFRENVTNIGNDPFEDWYINPKFSK